MKLRHKATVTALSTLAALLVTPGIANAQTEICSPGFMVTMTLHQGAALVGANTTWDGHHGLGCGMNVIDTDYYNICTMYQNSSQNLVQLILANNYPFNFPMRTRGYLLNLFRATPGCG